MNDLNVISGRLVDPVGRRILNARIVIENGTIHKIEETANVDNVYILPGFIDSHVHVESSMLVPSRFGEVALKHGTVAVVADPHEVANVAGVNGVDFMIENSKLSALKFYFGVPSCVPASPVDECYQPFTAEVVGRLLDYPEVKHLAEMMNFPGVIDQNPEVHAILKEAKIRNKPIDGHAPGLMGENLGRYVSSGISTDHECFTLEEANQKVALGMKVLIREGSAAKNFYALHPIIRTNPSMAMFCTDDCHPDELIEGHINKLVRKALSLGYDLFDVLQVASVNPVNHYNLEVGLLQEGQMADFIIVDNLKDLNVLATYINGLKVIDNSTEKQKSIKPPSYLFPEKLDHKKIEIQLPENKKVKVIKAIDGELITEKLELTCSSDGYDLHNDILKIVVLSRYSPNNVGVGFITGFGLKKGAIAASIAHDSHHVVAIGVNDVSIIRAVEHILQSRGGICYFDGSEVRGLALPFFGLMSDVDAYTAAREYSLIDKRLKSDSCKLHAPFMTMAFMSLSVIPHLKLTPAGLFDVDTFSLTKLVVD